MFRQTYSNSRYSAHAISFMKKQRIRYFFVFLHLDIKRSHCWTRGCRTKRKPLDLWHEKEHLSVYCCYWSVLSCPGTALAAGGSSYRKRRSRPHVPRSQYAFRDGEARSRLWCASQCRLGTDASSCHRIHADPCQWYGRRSEVW